jgi:hypothetical protein
MPLSAPIPISNPSYLYLRMVYRVSHYLSAILSFTPAPTLVTNHDNYPELDNSLNHHLPRENINTTPTITHG